MKKKIYANSDLCTGCELCTAACSVSRFGENNPKKSGIIIKRDLFERFEIQFICRNCEDPPCVDACITGAMQKNDLTGLVKHDSNKCIGCWSCIMICPYDSIIQSKHESSGRSIALKCDSCPDKEIPPCVVICPTKALVYE
ncbi:MAG: 4Fe-4S dicluster domain-containing protein [Candidatus Aminicenantia bacterium]